MSIVDQGAGKVVVEWTDLRRRAARGGRLQQADRVHDVRPAHGPRAATLLRVVPPARGHHSRSHGARSPRGCNESASVTGRRRLRAPQAAHRSDSMLGDGPRAAGARREREPRQGLLRCSGTEGLCRRIGASRGRRSRVAESRIVLARLNELRCDRPLMTSAERGGRRRECSRGCRNSCLHHRLARCRSDALSTSRSCQGDRRQRPGNAAARRQGCRLG